MSKITRMISDLDVFDFVDIFEIIKDENLLKKYIEDAITLIKKDENNKK